MTKPYAGGLRLVDVVRNDIVEGGHHGSIVVLGPDGSIAAATGDPHGALLPRSANKPMQAVAMLRAGLRLADPAELAVAAASHSGEPAHIERIRAMLTGGGLTEDDLRCPPDLPLSEPAREELVRTGVKPAALYMNCSGKHAAMLLTCLAAGWPLDDYRQPQHPLQRACRAVIEEHSGEPVTAVAVDGCGAAAMAISLSGLARAFLRIVSADPGTPERRVADAMRSHPELMSGTDREDARLIRGVSGLLVKVGAEGVHAAALPGIGAVAVKVDDGAGRARDPLLAAGLHILGVHAPILDEMAHRPVLGGGLAVGEVRVRDVDWSR